MSTNPKVIGHADKNRSEGGLYKGGGSRFVGRGGAAPLQRQLVEAPVAALQQDPGDLPVAHTLGLAPVAQVQSWSDVVVLLKVSQCRKWVFNPRHAVQEERIPELAKLIRDLGQLDPIIVSLAEDGMYDILCGQRRWMAIRDFNLSDGLIKAKVVPADMPFEMRMQLAVESQAHTDPLRDIDYALTVIELDREGRNPEIVLGKAKGTISKLRQMGKLPDKVLEKIKERPDKVSMAYGHELARVFEAKGELAAFDLVISIIESDFTVAEAVQRSRQIIGEAAKQTRRSWTTWKVPASAGMLKMRENTGEVTLNLRGVSPEGMRRIQEFAAQIVQDPTLVRAGGEGAPSPDTDSPE